MSCTRVSPAKSASRARSSWPPEPESTSTYCVRSSRRGSGMSEPASGSQTTVGRSVSSSGARKEAECSSRAASMLRMTRSWHRPTLPAPAGIWHSITRAASTLAVRCMRSTRVREGVWWPSPSSARSTSFSRRSGDGTTIRLSVRARARTRPGPPVARCSRSSSAFRSWALTPLAAQRIRSGNSCPGVASVAVAGVISASRLGPGSREGDSLRPDPDSRTRRSPAPASPTPTVRGSAR